MTGPTILVVDDSPNNREMYALLLEHFGYRVLRAVDGWDGIRQARDLRPDLILMDVSMPVLDGIAATELLKSDPGTREIPVIGVSAHDDVLTVGRAIAVGMRAYLTKPALPLRVLQEIERCLPPREPPASGREPLPLDVAR